MGMFTELMWFQCSQLEGKGGFAVWGDGHMEWHPESERAAYQGGGLQFDIPGPGQILDDYNTWSSKNQDAFNAETQATITETQRLLQAGAYGRSPESPTMVSAFDPVTRTWGERPENEDEKDARMKREEGDAAIRAGHITHDGLSPDEVSELSPEEYRAWRKSHPEV